MIQLSPVLSANCSPGRPRPQLLWLRGCAPTAALGMACSVGFWSRGESGRSRATHFVKLGSPFTTSPSWIIPEASDRKHRTSRSISRCGPDLHLTCANIAWNKGCGVGLRTFCHAHCGLEDNARKRENHEPAQHDVRLMHNAGVIPDGTTINDDACL